MPITNSTKNYVDQEKITISAEVLKDDKTLVFRLTRDGVIDSRFLTVAQGLELASSIENAVMDMNMRKDGIESAEDYLDRHFPDTISQLESLKIRFEDCLTPQQHADLQMAETKADKHRGDGHE
jgi:hypothetical protein|tara:strand:- start:649 stop:1020 length:372 start_codon:yes stop_codon:yes gene_type:complete